MISFGPLAQTENMPVEKGRRRLCRRARPKRRPTCTKSILYRLAWNLFPDSAYSAQSSEHRGETLLTVERHPSTWMCKRCAERQADAVAEPVVDASVRRVKYGGTKVAQMERQAPSLPFPRTIDRHRAVGTPRPVPNDRRQGPARSSQTGGKNLTGIQPCTNELTGGAVTPRMIATPACSQLFVAATVYTLEGSVPAANRKLHRNHHAPEAVGQRLHDARKIGAFTVHACANDGAR